MVSGSVAMGLFWARLFPELSPVQRKPRHPPDICSERLFAVERRSRGGVRSGTGCHREYKRGENSENAQHFTVCLTAEIFIGGRQINELTIEPNPVISRDTPQRNRKRCFGRSVQNRERGAASSRRAYSRPPRERDSATYCAVRNCSGHPGRHTFPRRR